MFSSELPRYPLGFQKDSFQARVTAAHTMPTSTVLEFTAPLPASKAVARKRLSQCDAAAFGRSDKRLILQLRNLLSISRIWHHGEYLRVLQLKAARSNPACKLLGIRRVFWVKLGAFLSECNLKTHRMTDRIPADTESLTRVASSGGKRSIEAHRSMDCSASVRNDRSCFLRSAKSVSCVSFVLFI